MAKNEIRRLEEREYTGIFTRKIQEIPGKCTSNIQKQTFFYREVHRPGKISWAEVLLRGVTVRGVPLV